jgi:hypothetical protein
MIKNLHIYFFIFLASWMSALSSKAIGCSLFAGETSKPPREPKHVKPFNGKFPKQDAHLLIFKI